MTTNELPMKDSSGFRGDTRSRISIGTSIRHCEWTRQQPEDMSKSLLCSLTKNGDPLQKQDYPNWRLSREYFDDI